MIRKKAGDKMKLYSFRIDLELLRRVREHSAGHNISVGFIIRRLLERYLNDEVRLY